MSNLRLPKLLNDLAADLPRFAESIQQLAIRLDLSLEVLKVDHISLRCHQNTTAERWSSGLKQLGVCFSRAEIAGRAIELYRLTEPLDFLYWKIPVIELPWPGEKRYPHEGWEHIEVVLTGDPATLGMRAMALFSDQSLLQPDINFKTSSPQNGEGGLANPTLSVTDNWVTIKFHPYSIETIVASEQT